MNFPLSGHMEHIIGNRGGFGNAFFPLRAHGAHIGLVNENVLHFIVSLIIMRRVSLIRKSH